MKLKESPFEKIKNGTKTIEFRLYDEKRSKIKIGDQIEFSKLPDLQETILVDVLDLYRDSTFESLFKKLFHDSPLFLPCIPHLPEGCRKGRPLRPIYRTFHFRGVPNGL